MERFSQGFYNSAIDMDKNNLIQTENQYATIKQIPQMICNPISTTKPRLPFEARKCWGLSINYLGTKRCSRQLSNQVKGNVDDMLERAMGSSFSRGRTEAKQLDEVNGTLVFHIVECSLEDLFQLEVIHTKLCQPIKMSAFHSLQGRLSRERLIIWYFHPFFLLLHIQILK